MNAYTESMLSPPWAWRKLGGQYHLVRDVGSREVILTAGLDNSVGDWDAPGNVELLTRDPATGQLVAVTPDMPVARLAGAAPDLLAVCRELLTIWQHGVPVHAGTDAVADVMAAVIKATGPIVTKR